jgi:uncharacterized protein YndB with AHSA1/START domain
MIDFTIERTIAAPAETVFDTLTDHRAYASMTPLRRSTLEREGDPAPNGVGALRRLELVGPAIREEVTAYDAPRHLEYRIVSGLPVTDHRADVRLRANGAGTHVAYRVTGRGRVEAADPVLAAVLKQAVKQILDGVQATSEGTR